MNTDKKKPLGVRLKKARIDAGMSQAFVAEALRVTRQSIYSWERGGSCPTAIQLGELATLYCVCAHTLLFGEPFRGITFAPLVLGFKRIA
ncbi:helix-turn-helix transcriptional regulator [Comamonas sp.]|uniref:helix-turn-helix transcriptional regulator n=1 Tax=Comamonas sp. TaxID=34028 RepID=UPI003A8F103F